MDWNARSWFIVLFMLLLCVMQVLSDEKVYAEALIKFKRSLTNARMLDSWKEPVDKLCSGNTPVWNGCLCANGSLVGLWLEGMGLGGKIDVESLADVPILTFNIMNNNFSGLFPRDMKKLGRLRYLLLANNSFGGGIHDDAFSEMYALREVVVGDNFFTGKIPLSLLALPRLEDLEVQNNQFEGRIPDFWQPNLKVNFSNNKLSGAIPGTLGNQSAASFSGNINLCDKPLDPCKPKKSIHKVIYIVAAVVGVSLVIIAILFVIFRRRVKRLKREKSSDGLQTEESKKGKGKSYNKSGHGKLYFMRNDRLRFEFEELLMASAKVLGSGSFGSSYKAVLLSGQHFVVKRFKQMSNVGKQEFFEHMKKLGKLSHRNLLPLVAFCYEKEEKFLISEFVKNGSLASHLHGEGSSNTMVLDWPMRLRIIKGIARGLNYLYEELPVFTLPHGHLKSSNILLDEKYEPLLTNYALALVINEDQAQQLMAAYKSPEFMQNNMLTRKADVWSLGILILELLTGRFPMNYLNQSGRLPSADLATWVSSVVREEGSFKVFDRDMKVARHNEGPMLRLLKIGMCCCDWKVDRRWELSEAVQRIEELNERDGGDDDYSSYASDGDVYSSRWMTDDDFSFSRA